MLTSQIFIITWTPTLKESRGLDGLKLGEDYDDCAQAFHLKAGGRTWSKDLPRMQLRRLTLHQSRGVAKACWFSVEPRSVLKRFTYIEDLVTSAWSQSKMKNTSLLTGVLSSRLEKKGKDYSRTCYYLFAVAFTVAAPVLWNGFPLLMRQAKNVDSFKRLVKTICFPRHFVEIF